MPHALRLGISLAGIAFLLSGLFLFIAGLYRDRKRNQSSPKKLVYRRSPRTARRLVLYSLSWAAASLCQVIIQEEPIFRLLCGIGALAFLGLAVFSLYSPVLFKRFRSTVFRPDPESMIHLSK